MNGFGMTGDFFTVKTNLEKIAEQYKGKTVYEYTRILELDKEMEKIEKRLLNIKIK